MNAGGRIATVLGAALALGGCSASPRGVTARAADPAPASAVLHGIPGDTWTRGERMLDSLVAVDRMDEALARARRRVTYVAAGYEPAWRLAEARACVRSLERRAALPPSERGLLRESDRALRLAAAPAAVDSMARNRDRSLAAWQIRAAILGPRDLATADAALALAESEFALAHVRESDSLAHVAGAGYRVTVGDEHPRIADVEDLLGRLDKNFAGRVAFERALSHYRSALLILAATEGARSLDAARVLHDLGNLYRLVREPDEAVALMQSALDIRRGRLGAVNEEVASTLSGMAFVRAGEGRWPEAETLARAAIVATPRGPGEPMGTRGVRLGLHGQMLWRLGRNAEAVPELREAVAMRESVWARTPRDAGSSVIGGLAMHRDLALALAGMGRSDEAFEELERSSARALIDRRLGTEPAFADPWSGLVPRLQRVLGEDEAVVAWPRTATTLLVPETMRYACVVRAHGPVRWVRLPAPQMTYTRIGPVQDALAIELRAAAYWPRRVTDTAAVDHIAHATWREWFAPLEPLLQGVRRLDVCSPELFWGGPLGELMDDRGRYLSDRFAITYPPSALLLVLDRERGPASMPAWSRAALIVGDPAYAAGGGDSWNRLERSAGEIRDVARWLGAATILSGADARAARLRDLAARGDLSRYGIVHIAAHAEIDPTRVLESSLVLAPDGPGQPSSRLLAREIAGSWRLGAELVCLATCASSQGLVSSTEGTLGLQQAFLVAGARSLLVTLWPVDDAATARLMQTFYARLADRTRPEPPAEALRDAQASLRNWRDLDGTRPYAHPAYWAGFVLIGDGG